MNKIWSDDNINKKNEAQIHLMDDAGDVERPDLNSFNAGVQIFDLPPPTIHFLLSNCNSNVYEKLIQTCKYIYFKVKVVPIPFVFLVKTGQYDRGTKFHYTQFSKIWITKGLQFISYSYPNFSTFFSKIYKCEAEAVEIDYLDLTEEEFNLLVNPQFVRGLSIGSVTIKQKNGDFLPAEKVLERVPKAYVFQLGNIFTTFETFSNLANLPRQTKLTSFGFHVCSSMIDLDDTLTDPIAYKKFDIECFFEFVTKNSAANAMFLIRINGTPDTLMQENKKKIEKFLDAWVPKEEKPRIWYRKDAST